MQIQFKILKRAILLIVLFVFVFSNYSAFSQLTRAEYIEKYKSLAINEMKRSGIPASITMAQALLESDNGNSRLAKRAKNHFGIKCHSSWKGKRFHQDDDKKHECFRKYKSVEESYKDHSEFLKRERYEFLFELDIDDYKGWARGLKKAGYATNSRYPQLLISIIEENNLDELDKIRQKKKKTLGSKKIDNEEKSNKTGNSKTIVPQRNIELGNKHEIQLNNRVKYIIVKDGDTFESINKELELMTWQLTKYNEISEEIILQPGAILYLQPKRNKAETGKNIHHVVSGETLYDISQQYAIKLNKLMEINLLIEGSGIKEGDIIYLRKKKK